MKQRLVSWLSNIGLLVLAVVLAIAVWVNAVSTENPDEVGTLEIPAPVTMQGLDAGLVAVGGEQMSVQVTIRAPRSVWASLTVDQVHVEADLSGKTTGTYLIPLSASVKLRPARVEKLEPPSVQISVERLEVRTISVRAELSGNLAVGFTAGTPALTPSKVVISGPASLVDRVVDVVAPMSVTGLRSEATSAVQLIALDSSGQAVSGLSIQPVSAVVSIPIAQQGGYRDFVIKAVIVGAVQNGFRLTGLTVKPSVVTLFSTDPSIVLGMPGYVETESLDITGAKEDVDRSLSLKLPAGVTAVDNSRVEVQVSISAMEGSQTLSRKVGYRGLSTALRATISPATVDVIINGPLDDLSNIKPGDVEIELDLTGYLPGDYKLIPTVRILSTNLYEVSMSPAQVEVVVTRGTATP